jgi:bacteriocin-like protein
MEMSDEELAGVTGGSLEGQKEGYSNVAYGWGRANDYTIN